MLWQVEQQRNMDKLLLKSWDFSISLCLSVYRTCCKVKLLKRKKEHFRLELYLKNPKAIFTSVVQCPVSQTPTLVLRCDSIAGLRTYGVALAQLM